MRRKLPLFGRPSANEVLLTLGGLFVFVILYAILDAVF